MKDDQFICYLSPELIQKIDTWRYLFANSYGVSVPEMNAFIAILLERAEVDLHILLWDFDEAFHVIEKLGLRNLN